MDEYQFAVSSVKISRKEAARRAAIAKKHDAEFVEVNVRENDTRGINNGRYQSWFSCDNCGEPFNTSTRLAVMKEIESN